MDPSSLLSQLKGVHAPDTISWWPPAIGWWLVVFFSLLMIIACVYFGRRYWRQNAWRRQAKREVTLLVDAYQSQPSQAQLLALIQLLKRSMAAAYRDPSLLSLAGTAWQEHLKRHFPELDPSLLINLSEGQYRQEIPHLNANELAQLKRCIGSLRNV